MSTSTRYSLRFHDGPERATSVRVLVEERGIGARGLSAVKTTLVEVPISEWSRKYGYVRWPKHIEAAVRAILPGTAMVRVSFQGEDLGEKRIDWKQGRISVGSRRTRSLPEGMTMFQLAPAGSDSVLITCA